MAENRGIALELISFLCGFERVIWVEINDPPPPPMAILRCKITLGKAGFSYISRQKKKLVDITPKAHWSEIATQFQQLP